MRGVERRNVQCFHVSVVRWQPPTLRSAPVRRRLDNPYLIHAASSSLSVRLLVGGHTARVFAKPLEYITSAHVDAPSISWFLTPSTDKDGVSMSVTDVMPLAGSWPNVDTASSLPLAPLTRSMPVVNRPQASSRANTRPQLRGLRVSYSEGTTTFVSHERSTSPARCCTPSDTRCR